MLDEIHVLAHCKINLHLHVLGKRADGFHGIESVFQLISLADELSVSILPVLDAIEVYSPLMDLPQVNTITRSIDEFRLVTGIRSGIRVDVQKLVPSGAGLGGGSSDAASVLKCLDSLFNTKLLPSSLQGIAEKIGSDVPFFLSGSAAVVEGRGEIIQPIASRNDLFGVLIWPEVHSSTAEAYGLVDKWDEQNRHNDSRWPDVSALTDIYRMPVSSWTFRNSFTDPLVSVYPEIGEAMEALRNCGASFVEMSGSGSSVFGLFEDERKAESAQKLLVMQWKQCLKFLLLAS